MQVFRYKQPQYCSTSLNPLEDCASWFRGLRSHDYTADILRTRHGITDAEKIQNCTKAIASHAESAMDLLDQAFTGTPRTSYLPLYYSMLNLANYHTVQRLVEEAAYPTNAWGFLEREW